MWGGLWGVVLTATSVFELEMRPGEGRLVTWAGENWVEIEVDLRTDAKNAEVELVWLDLSQFQSFFNPNNYCCTSGNCTLGHLNFPTDLPDSQYAAHLFDAKVTVDFDLPPRACGLLIGTCSLLNPEVYVSIKVNSTAVYLSGQHHPLVTVRLI